MYLNKGNLNCINWGSVAKSALFGAATGALFRGLQIVNAARATSNAARAVSVEGSGFGGLSQTEQLGIQAFKDLKPFTAGTGLRRHHLIEQRFGHFFPKSVADLSVALTRAEHQVFTNAWRAEIGYGAGTRAADIQRVVEVARDVYRNYPAFLRALGI